MRFYNNSCSLTVFSYCLSSSDNINIVRIFNSIFRIEGVTGDVLDFQSLSGKVNSVNLNIDNALTLKLWIYQSKIYVSVGVLTCHSGILLSSVIEKSCIAECRWKNISTGSAVVHFKYPCTRCWEELIIALTGNYVCALLRNRLDNSLLCRSKGISAGWVPVNKAVLLNIRAVKSYVLHKNTGYIQSVCLWTNHCIIRRINTVFGNSRNFSIVTCDSSHFIYKVWNSWNCSRNKGKCAVIELFLCFLVWASSGRCSCVWVNCHSVIKAVSAFLMHNIDKAWCFPACVNIELFFLFAFALEVVVYLLHSVTHCLTDIYKAFSFNCVAYKNLAVLWRNSSVYTVTEDNSACCIVDFCNLVVSSCCWKVGNYFPFLIAHINLCGFVVTAYSFKVRIIRRVIVILLHNSAVAACYISKSDISVGNTQSRMRISISHIENLISCSVWLWFYWIPVIICNSILLFADNSAALDICIIGSLSVYIVCPEALAPKSVSVLAATLIHLVAHFKVTNIVRVRMTVFSSHCCPVNSSVGVWTVVWSVKIFNKVCRIAGASSAHSVTINNLRTNIGSKVAYLFNTKVRGYTSLRLTVAVCVVITVNLVKSFVLAAQCSLPLEEVWNWTARITDRTKSCFLIQINKILFHCHCFGIKCAVTVETETMVNTEYAVVYYICNIICIYCNNNRWSILIIIISCAQCFIFCEHILVDNIFRDFRTVVNSLFQSYVLRHVLSQIAWSQSLLRLCQKFVILKF